MGLFSCDYLQSSSSLFSNDCICKLSMQQIDSYTANNVCRTSRYAECIHYKRKSSFWNFYIVNATYEALGKEKGTEVDAFGEWKCSWIEMNHPEFLKEYEIIAPQIVENIKKKNKPTEIFKTIEDEYLSECLHLLEEEKYNEAFDLYRKMYCELKRNYLLNKEK